MDKHEPRKVDEVQPKPMPHDAKIYAKNLKLWNFINAFYQITDALSYSPKSILIVGKGVGLEPVIFQEKFGIKTLTIDIDPGFEPDFVGSVHKMPMFREKEFDLIIVSHVLEHMPFSLFEPSIKEISRVSNHALIYLPVGGMHFEFKLTIAQFHNEFFLRFWKPPFKLISGNSPVLCGGEHYWECGYFGFEIKKIRKILRRYFFIDRDYHNEDWKYSHNFCLTSKLKGTGV